MLLGDFKSFLTDTVRTHLATGALFGVDNAKVGTGSVIDTPSSFTTEDPPTV